MLDRLGGRDMVIRVLTAAVVIGVGVWVVSQAVLYFLVLRSDQGFSGGWVRWLQILNQVSYAVWLGPLALMLLLWLRERLLPSAETDHTGP
jgi:hypothetical protein